MDPKYNNQTVLMSAKTKKGIKAIIAVAIAALVVLVVFIFLNKNQSSSEEYIAALRNMYEYNQQCQKLTYNVENLALNNDAYLVYIDECKNDTRELENSSFRDGLITGTELDIELYKYQSWHEWYLYMRGLPENATEPQIDKGVEMLTRTNNEEFITLAEAWKTQQMKLTEARYDYVVLGDVQFEEQYNTAKTEYDQFILANSALITKNSPLGKEFSREMHERMKKEYDAKID